MPSKYFFIKHSNNFFNIKVFYYICTKYIKFNSFNHKKFFSSIWSVKLCKICFNILVFVHDHQLRILYLYHVSSLLSFKFKVKKKTRLTIDRIFFLFYDMYCCIYQLLCKVSVYTFIENEVKYLLILFLSPWPVWIFFILMEWKMGGGVQGPVKPWLWNFSWTLHYIWSFKKFQNINQDQVTFLMASSYFKTVIGIMYSYE